MLETYCCLEALVVKRAVQLPQVRCLLSLGRRVFPSHPAQNTRNGVIEKKRAVDFWLYIYIFPFTD